MKRMENPKMDGTELLEENVSIHKSICLLDISLHMWRHQLKATMALVGSNQTQHLCT